MLQIFQRQTAAGLFDPEDVTGRQARMIEFDALYCDQILRRFELDDRFHETGAAVHPQRKKEAPGP